MAAQRDNAADVLQPRLISMFTEEKMKRRFLCDIITYGGLRT
jgi:hypothetical protein